MDSIARHVSRTPQRRRSVLVLAAMVVVLMMATAAVAPASSLGAPPKINSISPIGGPLAGGTSVVIHGARLSGATAVEFGSTNATSFIVNSAKSITAVSPAGTGTVDVTVATPEGTSATSVADQFTYGPRVTGVSPNRGPAGGGTSVTVTGSDFSTATEVKFGSANASFTINSRSSITAIAPEGIGTADVTVTDPEATSPASSADQFSYVLPPTVTSVSPVGGPEAGGTEVTITVTGTNLNEITAVDFGLSPATFFVNNEGSITAFSPAGEGVVDVTVTAFGGTSLTSSADQFRYVTPPTVTGVSPETGPAAGSTTVTITGTNLAEATAVGFGSSNATNVVVNSENSITAVAPIGTPGETVDVTVTTLGGTSPTSAADRFRYLQTAPLLVKKLSPNAGGFIGGTPVTISGSAFVGATAVDFGSAAATSFIVESQHTIKAIASPGTGTVDVTVTTPEGTSPTGSADQFSYVASPPAVDGVAPAEAREKGGTQILVRGRNFIGATEVHFGSAPAKSFVVNGKGTGIAAVDPAAVDKATVDVTVTTTEGTSAITPADRFTYRLLAPIITGLSIHDGPAAGGTTVNISGQSFIEVAAVDFGSTSATSFTVNSSGSITATSPAETVGKVKVTVTTPAGASGPGECTIFPEEGPERVPCPSHELFTFVEPTVTSVAPNTGPTAGGTAVTITGTGFGVGTVATVFKFGKTLLATSVDCTSITTCTAVTPAHAVGTVNVRAKIVAAPGVDASRGNPADQFTYD